ncbi:glycosyltransferase [Actinoplanes sp. NPDC026623]|uniref:glycosyltransferase n=1 Tax=Actinoplanes sp. NPDC026623 TaxID=3155610 RepID=UPI0033D461BB
MRVLHIISTLAEGGAEHQLRLLVSRLPQDCEVVTLSRPGAVAAAMRADGTTVHEVITTRDHDLSAVIKLRRLIRLGRFDVVHTHLYRACLQGRFAARLAGVRHVVATEYHLSDDGGARALYLIGERFGRLTIAASEPIADRLRADGVPDARITVIPKAIDAAEFRYDPALRAAARKRLGIGPEVRVIGGVGRLEPGKRFDRLIRAVGEVPEAILLLVGDGSARPALERLAAIEGVADRVTFAGAVGHAREMLCAMDVFASPSDEDTFGLVVLEALACGLPALYAVCPPLRERAVEGAERLSPHDPESLPRKLRTELLCFEERHGDRLPARSTGDRYDAAALADSVGQLYERMAGGRSPLRQGTREQSSIARRNDAKRRRRRSTR